MSDLIQTIKQSTDNLKTFFSSIEEKKTVMQEQIDIATQLSKKRVSSIDEIKEIEDSLKQFLKQQKIIQIDNKSLENKDIKELRIEISKFIEQTQDITEQIYKVENQVDNSLFLSKSDKKYLKEKLTTVNSEIGMKTIEDLFFKKENENKSTIDILNKIKEAIDQDVNLSDDQRQNLNFSFDEVLKEYKTENNLNNAKITEILQSNLQIDQSIRDEITEFNNQIQNVRTYDKSFTILVDEIQSYLDIINKDDRVQQEFLKKVYQEDKSINQALQELNQEGILSQEELNNINMEITDQDIITRIVETQNISNELHDEISSVIDESNSIQDTINSISDIDVNKDEQKQLDQIIQELQSLNDNLSGDNESVTERLRENTYEDIIRENNKILEQYVKDKEVNTSSEIFKDVMGQSSFEDLGSSLVEKSFDAIKNKINGGDSDSGLIDSVTNMVTSYVGAKIGVKGLKGLAGKVFKSVAKKVPYVGALISAGIAANEYSTAEDESKKKEAVGGGIGGAIGTGIGGFLGSFLGPAGTIGGAMIGNEIGDWAGRKVSHWFGDDNKQQNTESKVYQPSGGYSFNIDALVSNLRRDEGQINHTYKDSRGFKTIGVGHLLDGGVPLSQIIGRNTDIVTNKEAELILKYDIDRIAKSLYKRIPWLKSKPENIQRNLMNMAFNLGVPGLMKFKNTLRLIKQDRYQEASKQMLHSRWARQVGGRAVRIARNVGGTVVKTSTNTRIASNIQGKNKNPKETPLINNTSKIHNTKVSSISTSNDVKRNTSTSKVSSISNDEKIKDLFENKQVKNTALIARAVGVTEDHVKDILNIDHQNNTIQNKTVFDNKKVNKIIDHDKQKNKIVEQQQKQNNNVTSFQQKPMMASNNKTVIINNSIDSELAVLANLI